MDPTISQDQTAGKEAHEHQSLSVLGKYLKDTIKAKEASQSQTRDLEQKTEGGSRMRFGNLEGIFGSPARVPSRVMSSDDFEFREMLREVTSSSDLNGRRFLDSPADDKRRTGFVRSRSKTRSEQRMPDTTKHERINVGHREYSADLRHPAISSPPPPSPPPVQYFSGGKGTQRQGQSRPERTVSREGKMNSSSNSSPVILLPDFKGNHDDWSPATDRSFSSNRHVEVTEGYKDGDSEQTDASLRREKLLIPERHRRTEAQHVARAEALKYGNRLKALRSRSLGLKAQSESRSSLMDDSCTLRSESHPPYPSSAKQIQGDGVSAGVYERKSHTDRPEMSSAELPDTRSDISQEDRKSHSEPPFLSNGKQAHSQRNEIVPMRINAKTYRYRQRPMEKAAKDDKGVYKVDAAESDHFDIGRRIRISST